MGNVVERLVQAHDMKLEALEEAAMQYLKAHALSFQVGACVYLCACVCMCVPVCVCCFFLGVRWRFGSARNCELMALFWRGL